MTYAQINKKRTVPWWAMFGAPLVGVPLVVAALALVAPGEQSVGERHEVDFAVEQLERLEFDSVSHAPDAGSAIILLPLANS